MSGRIAKNKMSKKVVTVSQVKAILNSTLEHKMFTTSLSASNPITVGGAMNNLSLVAQGDDIGNRSGDSISMKELDLRIVLFQATPAASVTVRIVVFTDSMGSGGSVGVTEFLATANFTSPYNAINHQRKRFTVYHDEMYSMVGATQTQERDIRIHKPIGKKRYFNDGTLTSTAVGKNTLYYLIIASTTVPVFAVQHSLTYTDA